MRFALLAAAVLLASESLAFELKTDRDGDVVRWVSPIHFIVDPQLDQKLHAKGALQAVQAAVKTWSLALPNLELTAAQGDLQGASSRITVIERDWPYDPTVYAVTVLKVDYLNDRIVAADIFFNAAQNDFGVLSPQSTRGGHQADVQNTLTHELGHALGLMHEARYAEAVMYPMAYDGEVDKRALSPDDVAGLDALYPLEGPAPTAAAPAGCAVGGGASAPVALALWLLALRGATRSRRPQRAVRPNRIG